MEGKSLPVNKYELHNLSYNGRIDQIRQLAFIEIYLNEPDEEGRTPLHYACAQNHTNVARYLISLGANVNCRDKNLSTPLHWAVYNNNIDVVLALISQNANPEVEDMNKIQAIHLAALKGNHVIVELFKNINNKIITDRLGITPLHLAAYCGHNDAILALKRMECFDVNASDIHSVTPLHLAASCGHTTTVLQLGNSNSYPCDYYQSYPIHWAAICGDVVMLEHLMGDGLDSTDQFQCSPIFLSTAYGHDDAVRFLLAKGANLNLESAENDVYLLLTNLDGPDGVINKYFNEIGSLPNTFHWAVAYCSKHVVERLLGDLEVLGNRHNTPLHTAAAFGNTDVVELLIDKGANMNAMDEDQCTPLHWAVAHNHFQTVQLLLDRGADRNNALCWAAAVGCPRMVQLLVENGCDIHEEDNCPEYSRTPLMWAAICGHANIIEYLVQNGADCTNYDLIHWCAVNNLVDSIKLLLDHGVDVNDSDLCFNRTALHWAAITGNLEVTNYLLSVEGIELNAVEDQGDLPIHYAVNGKHLEITKILVERGADLNKHGDLGWPLCIAADNGDFEIVRILVEHGADVNLAEYNDSTPLKLALMRRDSRLVGYLIAHGAERLIHHIAEYGNVSDLQFFMRPEDVNVPDNNGRTPLFYAVHGNIENVRYLVEQGALLNHKDTFGNTALFEAVNYNKICVLKFLIDHGADVNIKNENGMTPMLQALDLVTVEMCQVLISKNADVHLTDASNRNVLHYLARYNDDDLTLDVIQCLIAKNVNINGIDVEGETPLHSAVQTTETTPMGLRKIDLFLNNGAEVNIRTSTGRTPLSEAVLREKYIFVRHLLLHGADVHLDTNMFKFCKYASDIKFLDLLVNAGLRFDNSMDIIPTDLTPKPSILQLIAQIETYPLTLMQLSRIACRYAFGKNYMNVVCTESLPTIIQNYLLFKE